MGFVRRLIPKRLFSAYHYIWALSAAVRYGFPSRKLTVVGVTGTNGKSSVVWLLARMLEEGGLRVAASSSIEFQVGDERRPNMFKMTMPGRWHMQKMFAQALRAGCTHFVLEVTSEGVAQHRHRFINFDVVTFLNLSREHIERHGSYEAYRKAKEQLFKALNGEGVVVVNTADRASIHFLKYPATKYIGFRTELAEAQVVLPRGSEEVVARRIRANERGIKFSFGDTMFTSTLMGTTNIENVLVSAIIARELGVSLDAAEETVREIEDIPGRLEAIENKSGVLAIVDYAHTPAALERVYQNVTNLAGRMICVLGSAGGGRDVWKRPRMGELAAKYCSVAYVTDEDPYDEDPAQIRGAVLDGLKKGHRPTEVREIPDRKEAIAAALKSAKRGDAVIVTGKGSESWMVLARGKKIPWDDRKIVRDLLDK